MSKELDSALFLLEKKLAPSWTSWSVVAPLNQATLDQVVAGFDRLDKRTKVPFNRLISELICHKSILSQIRFVMALLGLDANRRQTLQVSIKKLLSMAFQSCEEVLSHLDSRFQPISLIILSLSPSLFLSVGALDCKFCPQASIP